ncbi:ArsR family transcriptional regulator [Rubripirellula amarantea]|uniref:Helix-turn-helix domain protein n=1 Tax=Rubripirellula amarantea TaxID=2527999 RepID=A0A5C5WG69_9BACT|nr:helix-turn-helix transcriptional regulator [Rubripirellula amarantea]MDA8743698.1 ArsR family transcriptional regulator [Rubripirellula amarantea]TWT49768.1 Helix-turn-helix domain protein [Rubripirellula amarantea]
MPSTLQHSLPEQAPLFAALGDTTRLSLLLTLSQGEPQSVTTLAENTSLTRQAVRKHLHVLEDVGMVHGVKQGRENLFRYDPNPVKELQASLDGIAKQWDDALLRLKSFVEET